jgi:hypothetical protein
VKTFFSLLLILNFVFYALEAGYFGHVLPDGRDPARSQDQISPEKLNLLPPDADAKAPVAQAAVAAPVAVKTLGCLEVGAFTPDDARRAELQLGGMGLTGRFSERRTEEAAGYIVYLPPFKTKADADRASAELQRIGVTDFFIIQENGPFKLAISLGVFRTEEAAKAQLTALSQLGVRNARTGERSATVAKIYLQLRNIDSETGARLGELKAPFPGVDVHDCPAAPASAGSSSGT